jgi:Uncharacterized protein conserved in bacteria
MNLLELGGLLKKEREKHGLSLRDVMEATKISRRNLNALEGGEIGFLPHPVYLKGYVRNYARLVGLDANPLVAVVEQQSDGDSGYLPQTAPAAMPEPAPAAAAEVSAPESPVAEVPADEPAAVVPASDAAAAVTPAPDASAAAAVEAEPAAAETAVEETPVEAAPAAPAPEPAATFESQIRFPKADAMSPRPRRRLWPWVLLLLFAGVMGALYLQYLRIQAEVDQTPLAAPAPLDNATNATNATDELNATLSEANATTPEVNASLPAPEPAPAPAPAPTQNLDKDTPPAKALPTKGAAPAVSGSSVEVSRGKTQAAAPAAEVRTPGMQQLVITAKPNEVCWVEVSEGAQRKSFTLRNGDSRRFEFSSKAKVRLGNAGGVSFQLNGAPYPFEGDRGATATVEIGAH